MKYKILIVDDEEDIRQVVGKFLVSNGYDVLTAEDGAKGWEIIQKQTPDLIILDLVMPIMDGVELLKKIKEHPSFQEIPVILLTGKSSDKDVLSGYAWGADYYITKPFKMQTIIAGVKMMLEENKGGPKKYKIE